MKFSAEPSKYSTSTRSLYLSKLEINVFHKDINKQRYVILVSEVIPNIEIEEQEVMLEMTNVKVYELRLGLGGVIIGYSIETLCPVVCNDVMLVSQSDTRDTSSCSQFEVEGRAALRGLLAYREGENFMFVPAISPVTMFTVNL